MVIRKIARADSVVITEEIQTGVRIHMTARTDSVLIKEEVHTGVGIQRLLGQTVR